jgi:putative transposase
VVARKAEENPTWGYTRSRGALKNVGHRVARSTIARILKEQGIPQVLRVAVLVGYVSADALGRDCWRGFLHDRGVDVAPLLVIDLAIRRVQIVGCTSHPDDTFMRQVGRTMTAIDEERWPAAGC